MKISDCIRFFAILLALYIPIKRTVPKTYGLARVFESFYYNIKIMNIKGFSIRPLCLKFQNIFSFFNSLLIFIFSIKSHSSKIIGICTIFQFCKQKFHWLAILNSLDYDADVQTVKNLTSSYILLLLSESLNQILHCRNCRSISQFPGNAIESSICLQYETLYKRFSKVNFSNCKTVLQIMLIKIFLFQVSRC